MKIQSKTSFHQPAKVKAGKKEAQPFEPKDSVTTSLPDYRPEHMKQKGIKRFVGAVKYNLEDVKDMTVGAYEGAHVVAPLAVIFGGVGAVAGLVSGGLHGAAVGAGLLGGFTLAMGAGAGAINGPGSFSF